MQRLRNFPFSSAFQRGAPPDAPEKAPEDKRAAAAAQAKALWPDNKAILPESPPAESPAPVEKPSRAAGKITPRDTNTRDNKAPRTKRPLRLPPAPPMGVTPPLPDGPLQIQPNFNLASSPPAPVAAAPAKPEDILLLTEPLTISPQFQPEADMALSIQPQGLAPATEAPVPVMVDEKLMQSLTQALQANLGSLRDVRSQLAEQCVELALAAARSIAGHAIAADSLHVLRTRLPELLVPQSDAPPLQICVCPQDLEEARALVQNLAQAQGYAGQILLEADPRLERGDATVNWRQYGWRALVVERRATVEASVSRYLTQLNESQLPPAAADEHQVQDHG